MHFIVSYVDENSSNSDVGIAFALVAAAVLILVVARPAIVALTFLKRKSRGQVCFIVANIIL